MHIHVVCNCDQFFFFKPLVLYVHVPVVWWSGVVPWRFLLRPQTVQIYNLQWHWASSELCWDQHLGTQDHMVNSVSFVGDDHCPWYDQSSVSLAVPAGCLHGWSHMLPRQRWRGQGPSHGRWLNDGTNRLDICDIICVCAYVCGVCVSVCAWATSIYNKGIILCLHTFTSRLTMPQMSLNWS